jgi:hypothetical protein
MRALPLLGLSSLALISASACSAEVAGPDSPPASVRERLERDETSFAISSTDSAGAITALRHTGDGWQAGLADLEINAGEVAATAETSGAITLERLALEIGPIEIPETVLGYDVQLTDVHLELATPVRIAATWNGDNESRGTAELDLELTWSLTNHGSTSPLGAPDLPPVPVELVLTGDGAVVHAELRVQAPGELWSWADLVKLEDLTLIISASTPISSE